MVHQKYFIKVDHDTGVVGIVVEVMHLVFGNKEDGVVEDVILLEIHKMLSFPGFEPNDLVVAVQVWLCGIGAVLLQVFVHIVNGELGLYGLVLIQVKLADGMPLLFCHIACKDAS